MLFGVKKNVYTRVKALNGNSRMIYTCRMKHQRQKVYFTDKYFYRAIFPTVETVKLKNKT